MNDRDRREVARACFAAMAQDQPPKLRPLVIAVLDASLAVTTARLALQTPGEGAEAAHRWLGEADRALDVLVDAVSRSEGS